MIGQLFIISVGHWSYELIINVICDFIQIYQIRPFDLDTGKLDYLVGFCPLIK